MRFDEAHAAAEDARRTLRSLDDIASKLADMLAGRLRKVSLGSVLVELKRELRDFDARTHTWRKR